MNRDDIKLLFHYNDWANKRILAAAEGVTPEQLHLSNDLGWGSLGGALAHIMGAEYAWRRFLNNEKEPRERFPEPIPDITWLRERWKKENQSLWSYLNSLEDDDLQSNVATSWGGEDYHYLLWQCLLHLVNHGTQHRAECAALLTGFGQSPGDMDFTLFLSSR